MAYVQARRSQRNQPTLHADSPGHAQQLLRQRNRTDTENKISEGPARPLQEDRYPRESFRELDKFAEHGDDSSGYFLIKHLVLASDQAMASVLDFEEPVVAGDPLQRHAHFPQRSKWILRAMDEERWGSQIFEMICPRSFRPVRRMQRIGDQQQTVRDALILGCQHGCLAASVRLSSEIHSRRAFPHALDCPTKSLAILGGSSGIRRPFRPFLTERHIASQDGYAAFGESCRQGYKHSGIRVAARAVSQHEGRAAIRSMEKPAHRRPFRVVTIERLDTSFRHGSLLRVPGILVEAQPAGILVDKSESIHYGRTLRRYFRILLPELEA